jgi:ribose-phosphate pyrophosphokinase
MTRAISARDVVVFALPPHRAVLPGGLGEHSIPEVRDCAVERFSNGELYVRLNCPVEGRTCAVLGSLAPPDEQLLSVLLAAHTLAREGAERIVALLPYLGYARQDQPEPGQSLGAAWAGALLESVGVETVITVDLHSPEAADCLPMPVVSVSPAGLFARALEERGTAGVTVVAPDEGAIGRSEAVARAAGIATPVAHLRKRRDAHGVRHHALVGDVTARIVIVDDILDTGGTLISACRELRRNGAQEITVMVTHGLFTGDEWRELPAHGVQRIYATDSVPDAGDRGGEIVEVLPVGELIVGALMSAAPVAHVSAERP